MDGWMDIIVLVFFLWPKFHLVYMRRKGVRSPAPDDLVCFGKRSFCAFRVDVLSFMVPLKSKGENNCYFPVC